MSVLDEIFSALAQPASSVSMRLHGVATLTGTIAFEDDGEAATALCNVVATGVVQTASLDYAPPAAGVDAAIRFSMPLHYVWPANYLAIELTAVTLTRRGRAKPSYTIEFALPWTDVAFTAKIDRRSGVIFGSAKNALVVLALGVVFAPPPKRRRPLEAVPAARSAVKRPRE